MHTHAQQTHAHTPRVRARARACIRSHGHAAHRHTRLTHAKSDAVERTRAHTGTIVLFIPLASTLPQLPRSFSLEAMSSFATSTTTTTTTTYHCSLSPTLSSPSIFLRLSLSTLLRPLPRTVVVGAVPAPPRRARRSTSHPRSNAAGTKGRSLVTAGPRPSLSRVFLTSALSTSPPSNSRARTTYPRVPLRCAYFVPRKRLSSVPTVAISRTDANPLLHRHAPIFRAADSAETSHRAPRSTPAIPHSRSATRTNPPPLCRPPCAL